MKIFKRNIFSKNSNSTRRTAHGWAASRAEQSRAERKRNWTRLQSYNQFACCLNVKVKRVVQTAGAPYITSCVVVCDSRSCAVTKRRGAARRSAAIVSSLALTSWTMGGKAAGVMIMTDIKITRPFVTIFSTGRKMYYHRIALID